ncbi:MAG: hypothetical protein NWR42_04915, partial [Desulfobacterales bacterium]|nr:hypothetical protein [Desulfobacterales bacterium]
LPAPLNILKIWSEANLTGLGSASRKASNHRRSCTPALPYGAAHPPESILAFRGISVQIVAKFFYINQYINACYAPHPVFPAAI